MAPGIVSVIHQQSGATLEANLHGGTITRWKTGGRDVLFISNKAVLDGTKPIRGGIPIVFPQFGGGKLPSHGFARISEWSVAHKEDGHLVLRLVDNEEIRKMWDNAFQLEMHATFTDTTLKTSLYVRNTGDEAFEFQALQHTYYALEDISAVKISGFKGKTYQDKLKDMAESVETQDPVVIHEETDRVFPAAAKKDLPGVVTLTGMTVDDQAFPEKSEGTRQSLEIAFKRTNIGASDLSAKDDMEPRGEETEGDCDAVLWNPWVDKAQRMGDFGDEQYKHMVCVEPGVVSTWETLEPGKGFALHQTVKITSKM